MARATSARAKHANPTFLFLENRTPYALFIIAPYLALQSVKEPALALDAIAFHGLLLQERPRRLNENGEHHRSDQFLVFFVD